MGKTSSSSVETPAIPEAIPRIKPIFKHPRSTIAPSAPRKPPKSAAKKLTPRPRIKSMPGRYLHNMRTYEGADILLDLEADRTVNGFQERLDSGSSLRSRQSIPLDWGASPFDDTMEAVDVEVSESVDDTTTEAKVHAKADEEVVKGFPFKCLLAMHNKVCDDWNAAVTKSMDDGTSLTRPPRWSPFEGHFVLEQRQLHAAEWDRLKGKQSCNRYVAMEEWCETAMEKEGGHWIRNWKAIKGYLKRMETSTTKAADARHFSRAGKTNKSTVKSAMENYMEGSGKLLPHVKSGSGMSSVSFDKKTMKAEAMERVALLFQTLVDTRKEATKVFSKAISELSSNLSASRQERVRKAKEAANLCNLQQGQVLHLLTVIMAKLDPEPSLFARPVGTQAGSGAAGEQLENNVNTTQSGDSVASKTQFKTV